MGADFPPVHLAVCEVIENVGLDPVRIGKNDWDRGSILVVTSLDSRINTGRAARLNERNGIRQVV